MASVTADKFSELETRIAKTIELVQTTRKQRELAERELAGARKQIDHLESEIEELRKERDLVKNKVETLLENLSRLTEESLA